MMVGDCNTKTKSFDNMFQGLFLQIKQKITEMKSDIVGELSRLENKINTDVGNLRTEIQTARCAPQSNVPLSESQTVFPEPFGVNTRHEKTQYEQNMSRDQFERNNEYETQRVPVPNRNYQIPTWNESFYDVQQPSWSQAQNYAKNPVATDQGRNYARESKSENLYVKIEFLIPLKPIGTIIRVILRPLQHSPIGRRKQNVLNCWVLYPHLSLV